MAEGARDDGLERARARAIDRSNGRTVSPESLNGARLSLNIALRLRQPHVAPHRLAQGLQRQDGEGLLNLDAHLVNA